MKILIVAASRVGGTTFLKWISQETNTYAISEPMANWRTEKLEKVCDLDNVTIKINPGEFEKSVISKFDKCILLIRENLLDMSISLTRANETKIWHKNYVVTNKWLLDNKDEINKNIISSKEFNDQTLTYKNENNLLVTYEGIYLNGLDIDKVKSYLELSELRHLEIINKSNRYRKEIQKLF